MRCLQHIEKEVAMKRLAFLGFTIATLIAPIQGQAQQNCVTFPQNPNPEAELRYLLAHPNTRVCPSPQNAAPSGTQDDAIAAIQQGIRNAEQLRQFDAWFFGSPH
jgi:hypothetical protein